MARTALQLSPQQWQSYRPEQASDTHGLNEKTRLAQRRERAWQTAQQAAKALREQYGASHVYAFGSLAHDSWFTPWSDIDLAARGIPPERYYAAVALVTGISAEFSIDLVDLDACRPSLRAAVTREGIEL